MNRWYIVVDGWVDAYATNFAAMEDPSLRRFEGQDGKLKLTSSTFTHKTDYEDVLNEAQRLVALFAGAMHIKQDGGPLRIVHVAEIQEDGSTKNHPPHHRPVSMAFGIPTTTGWLKEPRPTFEQAVVQFALDHDNILVTNALNYLANPDWFSLYKVLECIREDLNREKKTKNGYKHIIECGWATEQEIDDFKRNADYYHRHHGRLRPKTRMHLQRARELVGGIVLNWILEVRKRYAASSPPTTRV